MRSITILLNIHYCASIICSIIFIGKSSLEAEILISANTFKIAKTFMKNVLRIWNPCLYNIHRCCGSFFFTNDHQDMKYVLKVSPVKTSCYNNYGALILVTCSLLKLLCVAHTKHIYPPTPSCSPLPPVSLPQSGAHVYVCGDAKHMAGDVHQSLLLVLQQNAELDEEGAAQFMQELEEKGRYQKDVWVT